MNKLSGSNAQMTLEGRSQTGERLKEYQPSSPAKPATFKSKSFATESGGNPT